MSNKFYDLEIDLSSSNAGMPRESMKDSMRVRLFGHSVERKLVVPATFQASVYFKNEGDEDVQLRHGAAAPLRLPRGVIVQVMFDGTPNSMTPVGW